MKKNRNSTKISIIIFSIIYMFIGFGELIEGADETSRFYYYDNILLRVIGLFYIIVSIGLLLRKRLAQKAIITLNIISILEVILTYDFSIGDTFELVSIIITVIIFFIVPTIFFLSPKVKNYFYSESGNTYLSEEYMDDEDTSETEMKHSRLGIASFVVAIVNILLLIILGVLMYNTPSEDLMLEEAVAFSPIIFITGLILIFHFASTFIGLGLGIAAVLTKNTDKTLAVWGICLNFIFGIIYVGGIILGISQLKNIIPEGIPSPSQTTFNLFQRIEKIG